MRMPANRIVILGGGGFIGSNLAQALVRRDVAVRIFDRPGQATQLSRESESKIERVGGDFECPADVREAISECDVVFHLVSSTRPGSSCSRPKFDVETNLVHSIELFEAMQELGVGKLVFVSSGGTVYGSPERLPIPESHATEPICSYGITKLAIEKYCALFRRRGAFDYTIFRPGNPYGPFQNPLGNQGAIAVFLKKALDGEPIDIWGDGSVVRDYVFIDDVVEAMVKVLDYRGAERVFNLGSGRGYSLNELIEIIEKLLERKVRRNYLPGRPVDVPVNVLDVTRAKEELDWNPRIQIEEGMRRVIEYLSR